MSKPFTSADIRRTFLEFFEEHQHTVVASSSLIPGNDPTLLFTNAGMVQFKDAFLGLERREYNRAVTSQKCMRVAGKHNDLENVGPSPRHHTFFEMLGNFSLGDYFKKEAIRFAYDLLTRGYGLDPARLYYTVHTSDDEAFNLWTNDMGIDPARVYRMGDATNFWQMADVGPCGPTSEIHFDWGPDACTCGRPDCSVLLDNDCDRWLEVWNLVFMQFNQDAGGARTPLPKPGVDTGMGLERIVSIIQNKRTNYQTDLFIPIMARTQQLLGHTDEEARNHRVAYRVIADHGRAVTFMVGDGVMPGNEGREYVLRLILRRAARYGRMAGFSQPFLADIADTVINQMGDHYTELVARRQFILNVIQQEEARFLKTFENGLARLKERVEALKQAGKSQIPGDEVFKLHATYGFPFHLTRDIAAEEYNVSVDEAGFQAAMKAHSQISGSGSFKQIDEAALSAYARLRDDLKSAGRPLEHNPYRGVERETTLLAIVQDGQPVQTAGEGYKVEVVLADTPYYVEAGGQVSDSGVINGPNWRMTVTDVRKPVTGLVVHYGHIVTGTAAAGDAVQARVNAERRLNLRRNH
ncbi:MAG: alanine--tRNA ligase, partial [Anaerolineae bacterium]